MPPEGSIRSCRRRFAGPAILIAAVFGYLYARQALQWAALGVFDQLDVLFDSDPNLMLDRLAHGWGQSGGVHAGLPAIGLAMRGIAAALGGIGVISDPAGLRQTLATLLPAASGFASILLIHAIARACGHSRPVAAAFAVLFGGMFVSRIFFSLPESYPLASVTLLCVFLAHVTETQRGRLLPFGAWGLLAAAAAAVTITNLSAVLIAFVLSRWTRGEQPRGRILLGGAALGVAGVGIAVVLVAIHAWFMGTAGGTDAAGKTVTWIERFLLPGTGNRLLELASLPTHLLGLPQVLVEGNPLARPGAAYAISISYEIRDRAAGAWAMIALGLTLWLVPLGRALGRGPSRPLGLLAALLLAKDMALHSIFGPELFLYGLHFATSWTMLLVAAPCASWRERLGLAVLVVAAVGFGIHRIGSVNAILGG